MGLKSAPAQSSAGVPGKWRWVRREIEHVIPCLQAPGGGTRRRRPAADHSAGGARMQCGDSGPQGGGRGVSDHPVHVVHALLLHGFCIQLLPQSHSLAEQGHMASWQQDRLGNLVHILGSRGMGMGLQELRSWGAHFYSQRCMLCVSSGIIPWW